MTTHEQFDDNEFATFFTQETQKQFDSMRIKLEHNTVANRIWATIEDLNMELFVGNDPSMHEDEFSTLVNEVAETLSATVYTDEPEESINDHARAIANDLWDEQILMIEHVSLALDVQLHGDLPATEKLLIKKKAMARILVMGETHDQWLKLADTALDGDPLDVNNPEDFEYITEALEATANLDNTPEYRLYNNVLTTLGVPDLSQDIPEDYDMAQLEHLTFAARDMTEAALCNAGPAQQPDRHSQIHEIALSYGLVGNIDLQKVFTLADSYAEYKVEE